MNKQSESYDQIEQILSARLEKADARKPQDELSMLLAAMAKKEERGEIQLKINELKQKIQERHQRLMENLAAEEQIYLEVLNQNKSS